MVQVPVQEKPEADAYKKHDIVAVPADVDLIRHPTHSV